jgi:hypothetical protein
MNKNRHNIDQLYPSLSVDTLEEIVRHCQRNERRLHELERHARHERKKAERLLRETYKQKQEHDKQMAIIRNENLKPKQPPIEYFISFDNRQDKTHRVRFNIPEKDHDIQNTIKDDQLDDLERRCENLILRLNNQSNDDPQESSPNLQQSLERFRPEFISHSRQRIQRINHLREEREHQQILPSSYRLNSNEVQLTYEEMKQVSKKKYEQLPEVNNRFQQDLMNEMKQRNYLRAKLFQIRLRQHVLLHGGRTNIDESLTMIDT